MSLTLAKIVSDAMAAAAQTSAPLEACGLLAGTGAHVTKCYMLSNVDAAADHYSMRPEEQFAAINDMRRRGLRLLAIWHSHPASPARMSAEDLRLAYTPDVLFVIVSLAETTGVVMRAYAVRDGVAHETPILIQEKEVESP